VLGAREFPDLSFVDIWIEIELTYFHSWYPSDITVYHMPSTIGISHNNDGTVPDVITLEITNNDDDNDGGLCEILTGIGGAIAGSVNGVGGGIFALGSLACKAI
jgi:hypothetical protein